RFRFHHYRVRRGWRDPGLSVGAKWQTNSPDRTRPFRTAREGELECARSERGRSLQHQGTLAQRRWHRAASAYELLRRWQYQILWRSVVPSARAGFRRNQTPGRRLTRMADFV